MTYLGKSAGRKIAIAALTLATFWTSQGSPANADEFCRDEYLTWIQAVANSDPGSPTEEAIFADINYTACKLNNVAVGQEASLYLWVWLTAEDASAQINFRAEPTTDAEILGVGAVEDFVHMSRITRDAEGSRWFYVTLPESGLSGWVREDFV